MNCPHCQAHIDDELVRLAGASLMAKASGPGPGAPRSDKERCFCGKNTMSRARRMSYNCCKREGKHHLLPGYMALKS